MMKHLPLLLFLVCCWFTRNVMAQDSLSIMECYDLARANYPQINRYGLINQSEQFQLNNIGKSWLPQLSVHGKASYQNDITKLPFDEDMLSSLMPGADIPVLSKDQYQVTAQLDQTIWDGGMSRSKRALTHAEAKVQKESLESELYVLNERVNQLYFGALLQKALISQNTLLQKDLQINIDRIGSMMDNGVANQSDLERMQVELLNAQQKEIELKAGHKAFLQMLGAFLNRSLTEETILLLPAPPHRMRNSAINRPEMRALTAQREFFQLQNQQLTAGLMPRFSAFIQGGYGRPALNMLSNDFKGFYVAGIRLSWNLGKLYTLKNDRREIETRQKGIELEKETFLFNTNLRLLQLDTDIQKMNKLIKTDENIIRLRSNIKKAAEIKLENGVIAVSDLITEINAEDLARQTAAIHRIQYLMNIYNRIHTTN